MTRREVMKYAAAIGGAVLVKVEEQAAPVPGGQASPLPGWSCEFKLHKAEATSLIINGEL